jgi:Leucine-rich repeat (LRR) protein
VSPLAGLVHLEQLSLWENRIEDVAPLHDLVHLERLWLDRNPIRDISALRGMTRLRVVGLSETAVVDLAPLVENMGLGPEAVVDLRGAPLDLTSSDAAVATLEKRGVIVYYDAAL